MTLKSILVSRVLRAALVAACLAAPLCAPTNAQAQRMRRPGMMRGMLSAAEIITISRRAERNSNELRRVFEARKDKGAIGGVSAEIAENRIQKLDETMEHLRRAAETTKNVSSLRNEVSDALNAASQVQPVLARHPDYRTKIANRWRTLKRDLNRLAGSYRLGRV